LRPGRRFHRTGYDRAGSRTVVIWRCLCLRNIQPKSIGKGAGSWEALREEIEDGIIEKLSAEASKLPIEETVPVALDWLNGRRTPFADQTLKGAVVGLSLGTDAPKIFRALVESTAFGSRAIIDRFREEGVELKSPYVMQVLSDVLNMPVKVIETDQSGALGAGMFAAVAAGMYPIIGEAQRQMGGGFITTYKPQKAKAQHYEIIYERYKSVGSILEGELRK
jgi:L-ribulokinase